MNPHIDQHAPPLTPENAAHQRLQAELRLFARLEASTILLQAYVEAGRVAAQQIVPPPPAPKAVDDLDRRPRPLYGAGRDMDPSLLGKRPYTPRVNATPMMVLALRAAEMLPETAKATHALAIDLIDRGVDLEAAVNKRRISDYVLQYLRECALDITVMPENNMRALREALDRIDEVVAEAAAHVASLPGQAELTRRRRQADAPQSPQGP